MPDTNFETITLGHGSGGLMTHEILDQLVFKLFSNTSIDNEHDGAILDLNGKAAFSTDSFVVSPIFFPGGNIGDLAVNGTMNDLAMCGAAPKYISLGLILEEGLPITELWEILHSIKKAADPYDVEIVTGDTKVVERGKGDQIFINTSGIGEVHPESAIDSHRIEAGDVVIVSGHVATHGICIMSQREGLEFETSIKSDTQYIGDVCLRLLDEFGTGIKFFRDPTRGGVASTLNEVTKKTGKCIEIEEEKIPVLREAKSACELLGLEPLYVANEGIFITIVSEHIANQVIEELRSHTKTKHAQAIGVVKNEPSNKVVLNSGIGGKRVISMLVGEQLPRIC